MRKYFAASALALTFTGSMVAQKAPAITGTPGDGARVISGTGQAVDGTDYTSVVVYVCTNSTAKAAPAATACSSAPATLTNGKDNAVPVDANGVFSATLKDPVAAGTFVWLTQLVVSHAPAL